MMKVAIIGWYGTETIGDRAILASVIRTILHSTPSASIYLGSLYPFFSEITLAEDLPYIERMCGADFDIRLFDSRNHASLRNTIDQMDMVVMGGGPLMDFGSMYMVEYAFARAMRKKLKTCLFGCGLGPLKRDAYRKSAANILSNSDLIILRDTLSKALAIELCPQKRGQIHALIDPAALTAWHCLTQVKSPAAGDAVVVNFRKLTREYDSGGAQAFTHKQHLRILSDLIARKEHVTLMPMHRFAVGGDDRSYLHQLTMSLASPQISVADKPLTLLETMQAYRSAPLCIGMRFHSVLMQTILNGNNYILDYTSPGNGKISGFLSTIDAYPFYEKRYVQLLEPQNQSFLYSDARFVLPDGLIPAMQAQYQALFDALRDSNSDRTRGFAC